MALTQCTMCLAIFIDPHAAPLERNSWVLTLPVRTLKLRGRSFLLGVP